VATGVMVARYCLIFTFSLFCGGSPSTTFRGSVLYLCQSDIPLVPKITADAERILGRVHCALTVVGLNLAFMLHVRARG